MACEARGVAVVASKGGLDCSVLVVHALEERALTVVELIGSLDAGRAEVPAGASAAHSLARLADLLEVVGVVAIGATRCAFVVVVIVAQSCGCVIGAGIALVIRRTEAGEALFVARHASAVDDELTLLALRDAK